MATDTDLEYSSGLSRVFWQLLILVAVVFAICYYNNNFREKKDNGYDQRVDSGMPITSVSNLTYRSIKLEA